MESLPAVRRKPLPRVIAKATYDDDDGDDYNQTNASTRLQPHENIQHDKDAPSISAARAKFDESKTSHIIAAWWPELLSSFISLLSIIGIVLLLRSYDGKPLGEWNLHINAAQRTLPISINFIVSLLGTLSKSTLVLAVSAALSQAKWNWFAQHDQPLIDYQSVDSASRGPWGSVVLLWRTRARRLASIGAFVVALSIAFDPFLQALITYPGKAIMINDDSVSIARAEVFDQGQKSASNSYFYNGVGQSITSPMNSLVASVNNGLWSTSSRQNATQSCGGNCTWPLYVSLAICSTCFNISAELSFFAYKEPMLHLDTTCYQGNDWLNVTLMPHKNLTYVNAPGFAKNCGADTVMTSTSVPNNTINFKDSQTLLFSMALIQAASSYLDNKTTWSNTPKQAIECGLTVCAATFNSSVINGTLYETVVEAHSVKRPDSWIANTTGIVRPNITGISQPSQVQPERRLATGGAGPGLPLGSLSWNPLYIGDLYSPPRSDFEIELSLTQQRISTNDQKTFRLTQNAIESTAKFLADTFGQNGSVSQNAGTIIYFPDSIRALHAASSVEETFTNIAHDMTSAIRNANPATTRGSTVNWHIVIAVHWPLLTVPALLPLLGLIYLMATIIQTRRVGVSPWKESALVGLVYGLDSETRARFRDSHQTGEFEKVGEVSVRLENSYGGPELVGRG